MLDQCCMRTRFVNNVFCNSFYKECSLLISLYYLHHGRALWCKLFTQNDLWRATVQCSTMAHLTVNDGWHWFAGCCSIKLNNKQHFFSMFSFPFVCSKCTFTGKPRCQPFVGECWPIAVEWNVWLACKGADDDGCNRIIDWNCRRRRKWIWVGMGRLGLLCKQLLQ